MKRFYLIALCILPLFANAQIKLSTFYFDRTSSTLTTQSRSDFDQFQSLHKDFVLQVIEMDAFSDAPSNSENKKIGQSRIDFIVQALKLEPEEISINNLGKQKVALNFRPTNWNRIDIYYFLDKNKRKTIQKELPRIVREVEPPKIDAEPITIKEEPSAEPPSLENIMKEVPIITPIQFEDGKTRLLKASFPYINDIKTALETNPGYRVHIRGHVCCGPNKSASKRRAKSVYKRLIKLGADKQRISYAGYSNTLPVVARESTEMDRKKNRRVDIVFSDL